MSKQIWERQTKESERAYNYFCYYRDLGKERSTLKVHQKYTKNERYFKGLSSKYSWVKRANAYDDYLEKIVREANEKEITKETLDTLKMLRGFIDVFKIRLDIVEELIEKEGLRHKKDKNSIKMLKDFENIKGRIMEYEKQRGKRKVYTAKSRGLKF